MTSSGMPRCLHSGCDIQFEPYLKKNMSQYTAALIIITARTTQHFIIGRSHVNFMEAFWLMQPHCTASSLLHNPQRDTWWTTTLNLKSRGTHQRLHGLVYHSSLRRMYCIWGHCAEVAEVAATALAAATARRIDSVHDTGGAPGRDSLLSSCSRKLWSVSAVRSTAVDAGSGACMIRIGRPLAECEVRGMAGELGHAPLHRPVGG